MQYLSSSGSTTSAFPSTSTLISGDELVALAALVFGAFGVFTGFDLRVLTLTAAPPSWLDCITVPGTSRFGRRLAAVGIVTLGDVSTTGVCRAVVAGVVLALARVAGAVIGAGAGVSTSSGGMVDFRDAGLAGGGEEDSSVLGAIELLAALAARVVDAGVEISVEVEG